MRTMYKVTANGIYENVVLNVYPKSLVYMRCSKIHKTIKRTKELLNTSRHKWFKSKQQAYNYYGSLRG